MIFYFLLYSDKMNKKRLTIIFLSGILILSSCYFILRIIDNKIVVPEKSLPKIEYSKVGGALTAMEMVGEEKMRKESSIIDLLNEMALYDTDNWEKIEKTQLEIDILEQEHRYRRDVYLQYSILYDLQRYGKSYFGYMFSHLCTPQGVPKGLFVNYKFEIEKQKNEAELLREDLIKMNYELKKLYRKRDITLIDQIKKLREKITENDYTSKREVLLYTVLIYKLKKGEPLEITPSWEEGERHLSPERDHVWVGLYNTSTPEMSNFIGGYNTDVFTSDMRCYWEEALKNNSETKSIRIKWIYISQGHKIIWEGYKNESEEWYTFAEYKGDPEEGYYTIVNMSLLNYPEYQQYYVVGE